MKTMIAKTGHVLWTSTDAAFFCVFGPLLSFSGPLLTRPSFWRSVPARWIRAAQLVPENSDDEGCTIMDAYLPELAGSGCDGERGDNATTTAAAAAAAATTATTTTNAV